MDVTSNNFNDLGLIPLPSNIEAIESKFQLNEVLYLDFDKQDQLLKNAVKIGIYEPVDYKKKPKNYCGMNITDNPYYDL